MIKRQNIIHSPAEAYGWGIIVMSLRIQVCGKAAAVCLPGFFCKQVKNKR